MAFDWLTCLLIKQLQKLPSGFVFRCFIMVKAITAITSKANRSAPTNAPTTAPTTIPVVLRSVDPTGGEEVERKFANNPLNSFTHTTFTLHHEVQITCRSSRWASGAHSSLTEPSTVAWITDTGEGGRTGPTLAIPAAVHTLAVVDHHLTVSSSESIDTTATVVSSHVLCVI